MKFFESYTISDTKLARLEVVGASIKENKIMSDAYVQCVVRNGHRHCFGYLYHPAFYSTECNMRMGMAGALFWVEIEQPQFLKGLL